MAGKVFGPAGLPKLPNPKPQVPTPGAPDQPPGIPKTITQPGTAPVR